MTMIAEDPLCIPNDLNFWALKAIGNMQEVLPLS